jgi:imidazolonepropionase-like amidohydrolase
MRKLLPTLSTLPLLLLVSCGLVSCGADTPAPASPIPKATPTAAATTAPPPAKPTSTTIKRVVVSLSRKSGTSLTTTSSDGNVSVVLDVLENGRGPHVEAKMKLAADGTIQSFEAHGHHTMGTKVEETFARDGAKATWKSLEESGSKDVTGPAFFVPISDVPDTIGLLALAMLKNGGTMPLLPGGTATIVKFTDALNLKVGSDQLHVVGYEITGLGLTPTYVWMYDDGSWFGYVSPWWSVVPLGFEGAIEDLIDMQNARDRQRDAQTATQTAHKPPAAGMAYTHARVLDVDKGKWLADQTVLVVGDKIKTIGPTKTTTLPMAAEVVDLGNKAILPGLWDMHSHLGDADGVLDIASGVTTARDVGNDPDKVDDFKARFDSGEAVGPHVVRFGFIEGRNEKAASSKVTAETEAEAKAAVELFSKRGYEGIKIYNSMKPELVPILAKEAHAKGMLVTGHIPVHMLANEAVKAGYDGIEHVNMLFLNFFATHDTDTRDTTRFTLVGDKAATLDLGSKEVKDFFKLLQDHKTVIDPTIDAFEDLLLGEQGKILPGLEPLVARLPLQAQRWFLTSGLPMDAAKRETYKASFQKLLDMVKAVHDAKIPLVVGTDMFAGLMLHHELALYVRAGITPADALKHATIDAARAVKMEKTTGSLTVGKTADLFVVDGDPLAHIEDALKIVSTMRGGIVFSSAPLYEKVGVAKM